MGDLVPPSIAQTAKPVPTVGPVRRPPQLRQVEMLARTHTERAIEVLADIMQDRGAPAVARVQAADSLLDRGWGKAPLVVRTPDREEGMTDEQLEEAIRARLAEFSRTIDHVDEVPSAELPVRRLTQPSSDLDPVDL